MNSETHNTHSIFRLLKSRNIMIDLNGRLFRVLPPFDYKIRIMKLMALVMIGFLAHIIKQIPYFPVTVTGNSIYSRVVAACLSRHRIPYVLCKGHNRIGYYEITDGTELAFEGPSPRYFHNAKDRVVPLIPHTPAELSRLQEHTTLSSLAALQDKLLSSYPDKNGVHIASMRELIHDGTGARSPIINIRRFCGNLYYIATTTETWLSRIVISDNVLPLQPGEIVSGLGGASVLGTYSQYDIYRESQSCTITEPTSETILRRSTTYEVLSDLTIQGHCTDTQECILYSLQTPRPFHHNSLCMIHPFHLPLSWDPFLTIMLVTLGVVTQ